MTEVFEAITLAVATSAAAVGLRTMSAVTGTANLAVGALVAAGTWTTWWLRRTLDWGLAPTLLAVAALAVVVGMAAVCPVVWIIRRNVVAATVVLFGMGAGVSAPMWRSGTGLPVGLPVPTTAAIGVDMASLGTAAAAVALLALIHQGLRRSRIGLAVVMVARDADTARLLGVRLNAMSGWVVGGSVAVAVLAGGLVAPHVTITGSLGGIMLARVVAVASLVSLTRSRRTLAVTALLAVLDLVALRAAGRSGLSITAVIAVLVVLVRWARSSGASTRLVTSASSAHVPHQWARALERSASAAGTTSPGDPAGAADTTPAGKPVLAGAGWTLATLAVVAAATLPWTIGLTRVNPHLVTGDSLVMGALAGSTWAVLRRTGRVDLAVAASVGLGAWLTAVMTPWLPAAAAVMVSVAVVVGMTHPLTRVTLRLDPVTGCTATAIAAVAAAELMRALTQLASGQAMARTPLNASPDRLWVGAILLFTSAGLLMWWVRRTSPPAELVWPMAVAIQAGGGGLWAHQRVFLNIEEAFAATWTLDAVAGALLGTVNWAATIAVPAVLVAGRNMLAVHWQTWALPATATVLCLAAVAVARRPWRADDRVNAVRRRNTESRSTKVAVDVD